jgi:hypothetical protein
VTTRALLTNAKRERAQVRGASAQRWTNPQRALFASPHKLTVLWGANGIGKSVALGELATRGIEGSLPWQRPGPQVVILAGNTWSQLGSTIRYMMEGRLRGWLREGVRYEAGGMKGQRLQVFDIVDGPGAGGELRLGTFRAQNLAGPRANVVISDEPLPEDVYNELWPRLLGRDGRMYMGFTPTLGTAHRLDYLWEMVDDDDRPWAGEIHVPLTIDAVTPRGGILEMPWMSPTEIEQFEKGLSRVEADMRCGRSRTPRRDAAYFSAWRGDLVVDRPTSDLAGWRVGVGIDHGSKPGSQRALVVACGGRGIYSEVHVMAEWSGTGRTDTQQDARAIIDMLAGLGLALEDVDQWIGDRAHHGDHRGGKKSNTRLKQAIAEALGHDTNRRGWSESLPAPLRFMKTPRKYDQSVWEGCEILHRLMVQEPARFTVAPSCHDLIEDLNEWQGSTSPTDPHKHGIDALRYIAIPMVEGVRH